MISTGSEASPRDASGGRLGPAKLTTEVRVSRALRALLSHISPPAPLLSEEEVVLSMEIEGIRYTLTQQPLLDTRRPVALSAREREVARLISTGHTNKTVAGVLEISLWTVDTHIRRIFTKLGVRSRSAMVARLAELGLLD
jgi:DNA-binding CsgD family transcriptional regulator